MSKFLKVKKASEVLEILKRFQPLPPEVVDLEQACGRVVARPVYAPEPLPNFHRATMDGYAVRARDTFGASETLPALLEVIGEISMGQSTSVDLRPGKTLAIPTGGMLPAGADAVVMVEYASALDDGTIEIMKPVAPGENVLKIGEDVPQGSLLFDAGWQLRIQDIGVLAACGITELEVHSRPRVAIVSSGDEIVPVATKKLPPGKVRDINTYTLVAQVARTGALVSSKRLIPDDLEELVECCRTLLEENDVVLLSGGSSVGARDYTIEVLKRFPDGEILIHGIAIRPGKPTILAQVGEKMFWGLPGQPVSAMIIFNAFVRPSLALLQGFSDYPEHVGVRQKAILSRQLPSVHGRTDYIPVTITDEGGETLATPVFGKSSMIGPFVKAQGYIVIPEHVEGLDRGAEVQVFLF